MVQKDMPKGSDDLKRLLQSRLIDCADRAESIFDEMMTAKDLTKADHKKFGNLIASVNSMQNSLGKVIGAEAVFGRVQNLQLGIERKLIESGEVVVTPKAKTRKPKN
jgi:hypothetical protein